MAAFQSNLALQITTFSTRAVSKQSLCALYKPHAFNDSLLESITHQHWTRTPYRHQHLNHTRQQTTMTAVDQVVHESDRQQFTLLLEGVPEEAFLKYTVRTDPHDNSVLAFDLIHTFVPPTMRGHGAAARLVKYAVGYAREHQHKVIPSCSYIGTYMKRHAQDKDVLLQ